VITLQNTTGQILQTISPNDKSGRLDIGEDLPPGLYLLRMAQKEQVLQTIKLLKI
jgi:hypothetical protein